MSEAHDEKNLHHLDLNVLVALDALIRERSVTKAAQRAGVTQSAMSHTLRRLRELFEDPLLVRGRGGMLLSPRAEALSIPLRSGLLTLGRALADPKPFDPAHASRTFRLVSPDLFDALVLPALLQRLTNEAPAINIAVVPAPTRLADALETGDVDLAIHPVLLDPKPFDLGTQLDLELQTRALFQDSFRCFARADHPAFARRRLTRKVYANLNHILVSPGGEGPGVVDRVLQEEGLQRRIALRVPHFATALEVVTQSDLVLTAPSSLTQLSTAAALVSRPTPIDLPNHAITMLWHPRFTEDPAHRWLRNLIREVTTVLPSLPTKSPKTRQEQKTARHPQT